MPKPITLRIDVTKIDKTHLFKGKSGTYLNVVIWPNKDGTDQFENTHYAVQELSREAREAGEKGKIIGNAKVPPPENAPSKSAQRPSKPKDPDLDAEIEDCPF